ncbi:E3 ubiquitin-protein ligase Topors-like [Rhopilema esculentum]|uniref:E3 ubiquitin-protein ligase Topors-like n=1 Tax=Rhopilema esculentum TaxID=499914 RepID=UPI0031DA6E7F
MADETEEVDIVTVADNAVKNESLPTNDEKSSEIEDEDENIDVIGGIPLNGEERIEDSREPKYSIINAATSSEEMPRSPQPGPSGIRNTVEDDTDEDSDDSVKIIEVPKKSVPLILISDSSSGSEIDVITTVPKKQQRNKKNPFKSIKEKLEEQKSKLFPVDTKSEKDRDKSPNKHDLTCAICLGTYKDRAFLEKCFHSFCFTCILQWSKVVHTCPLCKTPFQSLIHNITPDLQYHQYFVGDAEKRTLSQSLPTFVTEDLFEVGPRFRYHSTQMSHGNRANVWYRQNRQDILRNHQPRRRSRNHWGQQSSTWSHIAASEQRRWAIYQNGMVIEEVKHPPGRVRYRDTSVEFFQNNPAIAHRLVPWILRDLKVILQRESDSSLVLHLILSLLQRYPMESDEFYNQLLPYLHNNTRQFIRELISFASSPYDMRTYDSRVVHVSSTAQPAPTPTTALEERVGESQSSNIETSRRENSNSICRPTSQEELAHMPNNFVSNATCSADQNAVDRTIKTSKRKEYKEKRSATLHHSISDSWSSGDEISPRFASKRYWRHRSRENISRSRSRSRHRDDERISLQKSKDRDGKYHRKHSRSSSKTDGEYTKRSSRSSRSRSKERNRSARPLRSEREYVERRDDRLRNRSRSRIICFRSKERNRSARPLRSEREYVERRDDRLRNRSRSRNSSAFVKIRSDRVPRTVGKSERRDQDLENEDENVVIKISRKILVGNQDLGNLDLGHGYLRILMHHFQMSVIFMIKI